MSHSFQRVESHPDLDEAGVKGNDGGEEAREPAGQQSLTPEAKPAVVLDGLKPEDIIHSSVNRRNGRDGADKRLTLNIESSSKRLRYEEGYDEFHHKDGQYDENRSSLSTFMAMLTSCCIVQDTGVDQFQSNVASSKNAVYKQSAKDSPRKQLPRMFSRFPGSPADSLRKVAGYDTREFMLPPQCGDDLGKKTLVLDLDETLVHSSFEYLPDADLTLPVEVQGITQEVYVRKRPGLDDFLEFVGKHYEVGVFTASVIKYADAVLDNIDPQRVVKWRLFRESCSQTSEGFYVKDLGCLGRRLENTIIIDNSPHSYLFHPENAIGIKSFVDDKSDNHLIELIPFLRRVSHEEVRDVREALTDLNQSKK